MSFKKILTVKKRSLGDTVLFTAALAQLTEVFPEAEVHALVPIEWSVLLNGFPGIQRVWSFPRKNLSLSSIFHFFFLLLKLRRQKFDVVINCHASVSSAFFIRCLGIPVRAIHFHDLKKKNHYSTVTIPGKGVVKPILERDMDVVRSLGISTPLNTIRSPRVFLSKLERERAESYIFQLRSQYRFFGPILGMSLGASRLAKQWPISSFAQLAEHWCAQHLGGGVLVFSGPGEEKRAAQFHEYFSVHSEILKLPKEIQFVPVCTLRELAALFSFMSVWIGSDSGPKHVAAAVDTPTVTLFGPENPFEWHSYSSDKHVYHFIESLLCRKNTVLGAPPWCSLKNCNLPLEKNHQCMNKISVQSVLKSCQKVMIFPRN